MRPTIAWLGGSDRQLPAMALSVVVSQRLGTFIASENHEDLVALAELVAVGQVRPAARPHLRAGRRGQAIRYLQDGHARGKVVLTTHRDLSRHPLVEPPAGSSATRGGPWESRSGSRD